MLENHSFAIGSSTALKVSGNLRKSDVCLSLKYNSRSRKKVQRYWFTTVSKWKQCQLTQIHTCTLHLRCHIYICANSWSASLDNYTSAVMAWRITTSFIAFVLGSVLASTLLAYDACWSVVLTLTMAFTESAEWGVLKFLDANLFCIPTSGIYFLYFICLSSNLLHIARYSSKFIIYIFFDLRLCLPRLSYICINFLNYTGIHFVKSRWQLTS